MNDQRVTVQGRTYLLRYSGTHTEEGWWYRLYDLAHPDRQLGWVVGFYHAFVLPGGGWDSVWRWQDSATDGRYNTAVELVTGVLRSAKGRAA